MRKNTILRTACMALASVLVLVTVGNAQNLIIGAALGVQLSVEDNLYIDDPLNFWADKESGIQSNLQILFPVTNAFRAGAYFTQETVNSELDESFGHMGFGLTWLGNIPAEIETGKVGIQMGGYLGYGLLSHDILDGQSGLETGVLFGPLMKVTDHLEVAIHMASWSAYYSGGDVPEGVLLHSPLFRLQVYYTL